MSNLITPSNRMTSSFEDHKNRGTTGEDWGSNDGSTQQNDQFNFPCKTKTKVGTANLSDGTYAEYWNFTSEYGLKFSCRTCHCHDFKATGDDYLGSSGFHLHSQFCLGHKTEEWIQENRNGSAFIPFSKIIEEDNKMSNNYGSKNNAYLIVWNIGGKNYTRYLPESRGTHKNGTFKNVTLEITVDADGYLFSDEEFKKEDKNFKVKKGDKLTGVFLA